MAIDTLLNKFDIYYDLAGSKLGFMLAKGRNGTKLWRRDDERGLPASFAPGDISYANLSPDISKVISHRYMNGGLGALEFEVEDDALYQILRYLRSQNVDCRCKGKAYPGPKIVSLTVPRKHNFTSTTDAEPGEWDDDDKCWDGDASTYAYCSMDAAHTYEPLQLNIAAVDVNKVAIYISRSNANTDDVLVEVHYGGGWHDLDDPTFGEWSILDIGATVSVDKIRVRFHCDGTPTEGRLNEAFLISDSTNKVPCFTRFNDKIYNIQENILGKLNAGGTAFDAVQAFDYDLTHIEAFPDYLLITIGRTTESKLDADITDVGLGLDVTAGDGASFPPTDFYLQIESEIVKVTDITDDTFTIVRAQWGTANVAHTAGVEVSDVYKYWYMDTGESFTKSTITNGEADKFCKVGTDLWQMKLPNKMRKVVGSDPTNAGSWGAEILCGEAAYNVNDMWEHDGILYCMKEDGPYYESGGAFYPAFPELATIAHADSGKNSTVFRDGLYFRMGNQQEWEVKGGVLTEITPEIFAPGISQYAYPCVARAHDESWLYSIMKRGANDLAILAGRWEYVAGRNRWIWHEIRSIDLTDVATAFVCSVEERPYLYLGSTSATENVYKVYLPITNDATADADYRFHKAAAGVTLGSLWTPRYMTLLFAINKRWVEEYLRSKSLSGTNYINVYYSTDDGGSFDLLKKFITSPEQTEAFTAIEATMMNLRFDFVGDSETVPPVLKYHNLKALTLMPSVTRFYHTVKSADGLRLKKNHVASPNYTQAVIETFLDSIRDKVVTLGDRRGTEHTVRVRVSRGEEVFDEDTKRPEMVHAIEAVKV